LNHQVCFARYSKEEIEEVDGRTGRPGQARQICRWISVGAGEQTDTDKRTDSWTRPTLTPECKMGRLLWLLVIEREWFRWVDVLKTAASVWVQGNVRWCAVWGTGWLAGHSTSLARKDRPVRGARDVG
jgi:hypothetical protein